MFKNILIVGFGGFVGSVLRYLVYITTTNHAEAKVLFSWGTFLVNIIGCFLIGMLWGMMDAYDWFSEELRLLLMVGFCGGFTTFSSYALDSIVIGKVNLTTSLLYLLLSIVLGIIFVYVGHGLIKAAQ